MTGQHALDRHKSLSAKDTNVTTEAVRNERRNGALDSSRWRRRPASGEASGDGAGDLFAASQSAAPSGLERAVAKISRIQGPRMILRGLRALLVRNHRAMARCEGDAERRWAGRVHATLRELADEGDRVLPWAPLPRRIRCRARKS